MLLPGSAVEVLCTDNVFMPSSEKTTALPWSPWGLGKGVAEPSVKARRYPAARCSVVFVVVRSLALMDCVAVLSKAVPKLGQLGGVLISVGEGGCQGGSRGGGNGSIRVGAKPSRSSFARPKHTVKGDRRRPFSLLSE